MHESGQDHFVAAVAAEGAADASRRSWEREYAEVRAYTTSYRDDLDRGVEFLLAFLGGRGEVLDGPLLECGCGRGRNAVPLARLGYRVLGLDHAQAALTQFRDRACDEGVWPRAQAARHDLRQPLPVVDASVAAVLDVTAVDNLVDERDRSHYGAEIARVLRPGGWLLVVTFGLDDGYYGRWRSTGSIEDAVEDPHTGIRNQLFSAARLQGVFCPPLEPAVAARLVFVDEAASQAWTRRFLLHVYRKPSRQS